MLDASARLLRLLTLLQTPRAYSGTELAARLSVDTRTVRRDIEKLRELGYPVQTIPGTSGYRLGAGATMPPLLLDDEETIAVAVGLHVAATAGIAGIAETSVRALSKLHQVLPSRLRHRVQTLRAATVTMPNTASVVDSDVLTAVATACERTERLRFDYTAQNGTESRRDIEPLRIVYSGRNWYLVGWDVDRGDWRTFRLDRVRPRIPTGPRFEPREPPAEDLATHTARGISERVYRYRGRFTLRVPIEIAAQRFPPTVGTLEAVDRTTCVLRTGSDSLDELALYPAGSGFEFVVHEPPELIEHIAALTARLANSVRAAGSP